MIYGIDFGTSNTVVAYGDIRKSRVLQFGNSSIIPSLMYVDYSGKISIGRNAIADYARGLQLYGNKSDPYAYFRFFQGLKMVLRDNDLDQITLFDKPTRVEDLIGMFLRCLREEIETLTHDSSDEVVIGWPADLDEKANEVVMRRFISGCEYAGYKTIHFVHEPVAVLIDSLQELNGTCMIFDFGGGTLDLTVADVRDNHVDIRAIIGKRLGGYTLSEDIAKQRIIKFFGHGSEYQNYGRPKLILPYHLTSQVASFNTLPLKAIALNMLFLLVFLILSI